MSNPFIPYRLSPEEPVLPPWRDRRILVHLVVNVEVWPFDSAMPRKLLGGPHGREHVPDVPNFGWVEYGMRAGLPRLLDDFASRGVPASCSCNAAVIDTYPAAAAAMAEAGWEFIAHGMTQASLPTADDEEAVICATLDRLERFTGHRPRGWLGPGLAETFDTPNLLSAAGLSYVCDWVLDDRPLWVHARPRPLVAVPYTLELNDSPMYAAQWQTAGEFERRVMDSLKVFETECHRCPRVLTLGLHPHLIAVPHRVGALRRALDALAAHPEVTFVTGSDICDWFTAAVTPPDPPGGER
jgi:allantoinase